MPQASKPTQNPVRASDKAASLALTPVSRETETRLDHYVDLLRAWQAKTNLVAVLDASKSVDPAYL
jgi:16S rRNA (guanine527-N7)-methyltransferase